MTSLYRLSGNSLASVPRAKLEKEALVEQWVADDPGLLGLDLLIIGRQVVTDYGGFIDLLGMDVEGNLAIVELKRDRTPREVVAQVLDYASWVGSLDASAVSELAERHLNGDLGSAFKQRFGEVMPDAVNATHRMIIVASALDASSQRIVRYLAETHRVDIDTAFFRVFDHNGETLLTTDRLLGEDATSGRSGAKPRFPWQGLWYVNTGDGTTRAWEDMRRYGFVSAGGGKKYSGALKRLSVGHPLVAYSSKGQGYVGYGIVTATSVPVSQFETASGPLLRQELASPNLGHDANDPELEEWAVAVNWAKAVSLSEAKWQTGLFANPNVVCRLRDLATIQFLQHTFGVDLAAGSTPATAAPPATETGSIT